ncbi:MAG: DUF4011 domain-containing protein, partial [Oceanospirillales bacterium]|nr:DUF4011 domain-containing protein [Oceanospirillales bacterium]
NGVDALSVSMGQLWFSNADAERVGINDRVVRKLGAEAVSNRGVVITGHFSQTLSSDTSQIIDKCIAGREEAEPRMAYYLDYIAWEQRVYHHDALSDVYVLGLILASLAGQLDLTEPDDLATFVRIRTDIRQLNDRIHPVVAQAIAQMTSLVREERPQDLATLTQALYHYRDQDIDDSVRGISQEEEGDKRAIQRSLRNKLFEISRRNRLLYFRESGGSVNLTHGSVPHVLDYRSIRSEQLMTANQYLYKELSKGKSVSLSRWLRFEDYPYLAGSLDKIRLQANRDEKEYGFSQLRLVLAFFRWHNLKEAPEERINTPLLLAPAKLLKKKGVKDHYLFSAELENVEVNPVLRHQLQQLYGISLPESINAEEPDAIRSLYESLSHQIDSSTSGVGLAFIDQPRIKLIATKAKRKLDDFRRKVRITGRGVRDYKGLAYSYARDKFEPLGVQIFERNVRVSVAPCRELVEDPDRAAVFNAMTSDEATVERDLFVMDVGSASSKNQWEFDLCSLTLANFNYRKMTLVRDYSELLNSDDLTDAGVNFSTLFSDQAKETLSPLAPMPLKEQFHVLPADPSQTDSVLRGRSGQSYVIQGPPGTGKSQTITNLIVDYLARNKSVLFVCEKRVALDVVFHRLKQIGLDSLCALIHDSQADKKAFINDLEEIYQRWLKDVPETQEGGRNTVLAELEQLLDELEQFSDSMQANIEGTDTSLRQLIQLWVAGGCVEVSLDPADRALLPTWETFRRNASLLGELSDRLASVMKTDVLAATPLWCLSGSITRAADPQTALNEFSDRMLLERPRVLAAADRLSSFLQREALNWQGLLEADERLKGLLPLMLDEQIGLLDGQSLSALKLKKQLSELDSLAEDAKQKSALAAGWDLTVDIDAIKLALNAARDCEGRWWSFLSGRWRRAKKLVREKGAAVEKGYTQSLSNAYQAILAGQALADKKREIETRFALEDADIAAPLLSAAWQDPKEQSDIARSVYRACLAHADDPAGLVKLTQDSALRDVDVELSNWLTAFQYKQPVEVMAAVEALRDKGEPAFEIGDLLQRLDAAGMHVSHAIRLIPLSVKLIESVVIADTISLTLRRNRALNHFEGERLGKVFNELDQVLKRLRDENSASVRRAAQLHFQSNIQRASGSMAGTSEEEKNWRRSFNRGRKLLEREFEKTRAFKSVRELLSSDSGTLLRNLKPIWMMSPLSISDVLPLNEELFDVVIFDEASQIPLEDAVPALYRARQMIVVGDEMQLPPSAFFASQGGENEDQDSKLHLYNINADSFLTRAVGALPSTILSWHYRSRHESLIGFCNQAFYTGQLKTVPSTRALIEQAPVNSGSSEAPDVNGGRPNIQLQDHLYSRPISYHKLENSPYSKQRNKGEAEYIAHLVRELLLDDSDDNTLGIVAFSQAQQNEIEQALDRLAAQDKAFAARLDAEEEREQDGQFVGLFVKNLENVQGDERDIIILSICYGPGQDGRMLMNFGPINQNGGEKRLNVIFSRAKKHMVVVTSIEPNQITNTYNTGANALRQYLRYAQAVSEGDSAGIQSALLEYGYSPSAQGDDSFLMIEAIAQRLRSEGLHVVTQYGQSSVKCDLAVRRAEDRHFSLGILTDNVEHYKIKDLINRYHTQGSVLSAFGWTLCHVLAKDWYKDSDAVVKRILANLKSQETVSSE